MTAENKRREEDDKGGDGRREIEGVREERAKRKKTKKANEIGKK